MGGTFDPLHYGHLVIAEMARAELGLERVVWLPAGDPPHKDRRCISPQEHRYAMTLLATAEHPAFEVSRLEMEREGPSYTLLTVEHFRREYPEAELYFIVGADSILEILTWHRHAELVRACRFAAATRPGYDLAQMRTVLPPDYLERIDPIVTPGVDVSSTELRERLRTGRSVRYLVPEPVEAYVRKHQLYTVD